MPYIGQSPEVAQRRYESIDDISGSFNGSTTSFALQVGGVTPAPFPVASENVLISVGGVIQEPDGGGTNGFQLTGTNIVFSSAPASGQSFFGVILAGADYVTAGHAFPDGDLASPSVTFASDLDTGLFRPDSGALAFGGNGAERLRVDGSGRLLLGTTTEGEATADNFTIADSGHCGITLRSGTSSVGTIFFSDGTSGTDEYRGYVQYDHSGNFLKWATDATERVRIDSSGKIGVGENNPQKFVHVSDAGSSNVVTARFQQSTTNTSTDGGSLLELGGTRSDGTYGFYGGIKGGRRNSASDNKGYLAFFSDNNDGQSLAERMRLDDAGRLLVGSTSYSFAATAVLQGNSSNSGEDAVLRFNRGGTPGANADLGIISFGDNAGNVGASIRSANTSAASWATNDYPGNLTFHTTADGASSPTERMKISYDGTLRAQGVYDNTLSSSANVHVDSGGLIRRVTSSAKYKTNIETIEDSYADALLNCRPVWYQSTCEGDNPDYGWWGFIAEEVAEIDPRLVHWKTTNVTYDEDGRAVETPCDPEAEGVLYDRFVPHLVNLVKRQKATITAQQAQIDDLLARVTALEAA